jgi:hypothetical protein
VTFGSFNAVEKLVEPVIETWAEILKAVPDSRIIIKNMALSSGQVQEQLKASFAKAGLDTDRVEGWDLSRTCVAFWSSTGGWMWRWTPSRMGHGTTCEALGWVCPW